MIILLHDMSFNINLYGTGIIKLYINTTQA